MTTILTSLIESVELDLEALQEQYNTVRICYSSWTSAQRSQLLPHLATRIYNAGPVLALIQVPKDSRYWALLPVDAKLNLHDDALSCKKEQLDSVQPWILTSLLVRAIPGVLSRPDDKTIRFETDGLYYVVEHKKSSISGSSILVTVNIDVQWSQPANKRYLAIKTSTFTPLKLHETSTGSLPHKVAKATRYQMDRLGQNLTRNTRGEYIKKAFWRKTNNRVPAFKLDGVITLESYYKTRLGIISLFKEDLQHAYNGMIKIELQQASIDSHKQIATTAISQSYSSLLNKIKQLPIQIINLSDDPAADKALVNHLQPYEITLATGTKVVTDSLNLLLVNERDSYQNGEPDPYQELRKKHPAAVIQSCYPASLKSNPKQVVEVLLKELFIKYEINQGRLMHDYPVLPVDVCFITSIRPEGEITAKTPWPMFSITVKNSHLDCAPASQELIEKIKETLTEVQSRAIFQGFNRADLVFWPATGDVLTMADTGAVCLPNEPAIYALVKEMDYTAEHGVPRTLIEIYCQNTPDSSILEVLAAILAAPAHSHQIPVSAFRQLQYKKKDAIHIYDYLAEHGYRIKASLQSKKGGALSSTSGIWIDKENNLYAVGSPGSAQRAQENFNRIYRVESNGIKVPDWFWDSLEVWHIRHKGATVYPYIFKHIREFAQRYSINMGTA